MYMCIRRKAWAATLADIGLNKDMKQKDKDGNSKDKSRNNNDRDNEDANETKN